MDKHKAATEVTIARTEEETALHRWVTRYGKTAAFVAALLTAGILLRVHLSQRTEAVADASWDRLRQEVSLGAGFIPFITTPEVDVLGRLAEELGDDQAGPWVKALEVGRFLEDGDREGALRALEELETRWPDHAIAKTSLPWSSEADPETLGEHLRGRIERLETWEAERSNLLGNPPLPEGSPRVRMQTTEGELVLGLFEELAPLHTENFLKLCREGFYDQTAFHRVMRGFMVQGGDPNTREGDPSTWGQGGPGYTIVQEETGLYHFRHVLAAAKKPGDIESSGSQFYVTTAPAHHLDGQHTVFGVLLEGGPVVDRIESAPVTGERPDNPVRIESCEVLPD